MATTKSTSATLFGKLALARVKFLEAGSKKSGKNMHLEFMYFELEDIVPTATKIFQEVGLLGVVNITPDAATMQVFDTDNMETAPITFTVPYREMEQIVSNSGKVVTNVMQALGMSVTYLRRYLWMLALDVVEADAIDANLGAETPASAPAPADNKVTIKTTKAASKKPATAAERETVKKELTNTEAPADKLQLDGLKAACKKLLELDKEKEDFVQKIAIATKGFTETTKDKAEQLVKMLNDLLSQYPNYNGDLAF